MPSCVVKTCKNYMNKLKKKQGITYHSFPRNKNRRNDWVLVIRECRGESNWNPSSSSTVCSAHFDDADFITTAKGLRCLVQHAIPKRLLSNSSENPIQRTSSSILQMSQNVKREIADDQQPTSSSSTISSLLQVPALTDESTFTGYCRLCARSICDGILVNVQSDSITKQLVVNMLNRLNTYIDFSQEYMPTTICSGCIKSLYSAYDFIVGIDLAQVTLNKKTMPKHSYEMPEKLNQETYVDLTNTTLQQANNGSNFCDLDQSLLHLSSRTTSSQQLSSTIEASPRPHSVESAPTIPLLIDTPRKRRLKDIIHTKRQIIDRQTKNIKRLNQKVRRFRNRNKSLKNFLKHLKERIQLAQIYTTH